MQIRSDLVLSCTPTDVAIAAEVLAAVSVKFVKSSSSLGDGVVSLVDVNGLLVSLRDEEGLPIAISLGLLLLSALLLDDGVASRPGGGGRERSRRLRKLLGGA